MTLKVKCNVEPTKSDKWLRLTPVEKSPVGPLNIKADAFPTGVRGTVTVTING